MMRIGLIAPPWIPVPPITYGGTEAVVDNLARGLVRLGHQVRLFTIGESTCPVPSDHLFERAVEPIGQTVPEAAHVLAAYESLADMDIIHDHTILGPLMGARARPGTPPVVVTNHGPFTETTRRIFARIATRAAVVAVSADQARRAGEVPIAAVIHHGIDLDAYRPGTGAGGHLVFVGRMCADKGVHRAVRIAHAAGRPLRIISRMRVPEEEEYYEAMVRPLLSTEDEVPEELPFDERIAAVQEAMALVNPISWPEPFGLVMAESLAMGTPVIAYPNGAAPEIVTHRRTGYLCSTESSAADAAARVEQIDRATCREDAENRFSLDQMARKYVAVYERILAAAGVPSPRMPTRTLARWAPAATAPRTGVGLP
jgi:glycosyltransferase involved in cell wall biosynthesis